MGRFKWHQISLIIFTPEGEYLGHMVTLQGTWSERAGVRSVLWNFKMELWSWRMYGLAGDEDPVTGGRWSAQSPWDEAALQLLTFCWWYTGMGHGWKAWNGRCPVSGLQGDGAIILQRQISEGCCWAKFFPWRETMKGWEWLITNWRQNVKLRESLWQHRKRLLSPVDRGQSRPKISPKT